VEEDQHQLAVLWPERLVTTDQLVVVDPAVGETHGSVRHDFHALAAGQAWSQDHRVEEVVVASNIGMDGTVVERAGKKGDEVQLPARSALEKAPAWDLYDYLDPWQLQVH